VTSYGKRLRRIALVVLVTVAAGVATEGLLRTIAEPETMFHFWFTPGIQLADEEFGFRFTPGYRGFMRHRDRVFGVPLALDEHGFRPAILGDKQGPRTPVTLIGGRSMMFSFGLFDEDSIAGQLAAASRQSLEVRSAVWGGFDLYRMWHIYQRTLAKADRPKVVILSLYNETLEEFHFIPERLDQLPAPQDPKYLFRFVDGLALSAAGPLHEALGRHAYRSFLGYGLLSRLDPTLARVWGRVRRMRAQLAPRPAGAAAVPPSIREIGRANFTRMLEHIRDELAARGTQVMLVFLPVARSWDFYQALETAIPAGITPTNLHQRLFEELPRHQYIADGHYGAEHARIIGSALAREVDTLLDREHGSATALPRPIPHVVN
jgi:hypothetical protein